MKKIILFTLLIISVVGYGQNKYVADRYFQEYSYKKSAELYESLYQKGDSSQTVISRLADSYYFNAEFEKAEKWYEKLMLRFEEKETSKHFFYYAQTLKSNGKIKESDEWLKKLKNIKETDSRAAALLNNENYFVEYTNKKKTFVNINNISVNTKYSDFGGFIYNNKLYYASARPLENVKKNKLYNWNNQPFLNIYTSNLLGSDEGEEMFDVDLSERLTELSSIYHESNIVITKDGKTAYFTRDNFDGKKLESDEDRTSHLKIYKAIKKDGKWSEIKELPFNSDDFSCGHPALSSDEKTLYFISDMPGGVGGPDLYKVKVLENNRYSTPENLGGTINTEGREMFPFIGSDNTLYFASDGHLGLGALDVFEAKKVAGKYTNPINLGTPVNSPRDDFSFVINNKKTKGFFSSNRKKGKGDDDIYSFTVYKCKEKINGTITDVNTGEPIKDVLIRLIDEEGNTVFDKRTDEKGVYMFEDIDCEKKYVLAAVKEGYRNTQKNTETLDVDKQLVTTNLQLESLIVENQIVINPIYFDFDLFDIREDAKYELENIVSVMKANPHMIIKIESHTDSRGSKKYNEELSTKRAKSTRDYIVSRGISSDRIESALGYGESQLLNDCNGENQNKCTKEEHQKNRRSYFYIVNSAHKVKALNK